MRAPIVVLGFCCGIAGVLFAQQETSTAPPEQRDSALVEASKKAKPRSKTRKKVITNADVKKSTGKIVVLQPKPPLPGETEAKNRDPRSPLQKQDDDLRARRAAAELVTAAEKKVTDLEKELNRVEQSFYDENDANYRDTVIQKRFDQTKRQLDDARAELADARDVLSGVGKQ
jgi:type IV secretory pathway VirB10-like protein